MGSYPSSLFDKYDVYRAGDFGGVRTAMEAVDKAIAELARHFSVLPRVNQDGSSECHFAEALYFKKAEAEVILERAVKRLRSLIDEFGKKADSLMHLAYETRDPGEAPNDTWITKANQYKDTITSLRKKITESNLALSKSSEKKWPKGEPRGPFGLRPGQEVRVESERETTARHVRRLMGEA